MTYKSYIQIFDFAEPDYSWLSENIQAMDRSGLSKMENEILNGIIYQRSISKYLAINHNDALKGLAKISFSGAALSAITFLFLMFTYYLNVNLHLGMNFLTELFA